MFSRLLTPPVLVAAAVGVPYVATNGPDVDKLWNKATTIVSSTQAPAEQTVEAKAETATTPAAYQPRLTTVSLNDAFNLDVSKEWVYQRWDRKSTALSELGLYGVRVSLISGTQLHDVAGSLTYYFGRNGRVERISFRGRTADTSQLIRIAQHYGLQPQPTAIVGEQLMQVRREEQVFSELRTRPEPVLRTKSLRESFLVNFELQRPDATTPLPSQQPMLPVAAAPPQPVNAEQDSADKEVSKAEALNPYFPRSRVPAEQVENLERRDRLW